MRGMGKIEFATPADIRGLQERLLGEHVRYVMERSPYYRRVLKGMEMPDGPFSLDRLSELPITDKSAFSDHNDELLAVPMSAIEDIVLSSGTTGRPTRVMYTRADLDRLAYNEHISFASTGLTADDVVLLTCTIDRCFIAGLAYYLGVRSLGAAAIRNGLNSLESHAEIISRLRPTAIVGVPSFLAKLGSYMTDIGRSDEAANVRRLICIGEQVRDSDLNPSALGLRLAEAWGGATVFSTYASSETITSFCECTAGRGGHLHPELAVVEILDDDGNPVSDGEAGEVTVTPLRIEGMPLLRFRTGDVSFLVNEPCACGRNSARLGPILGRKKHMMKFRGTTLYPNVIFGVLDGIAGVREYCLEVSSGDYELSDEVRVLLSVGPEFRGTAVEVMNTLQAGLRVRPEVRILGDDDIRARVYAGGSRKPIRFMDMRK